MFLVEFVLYLPVKFKTSPMNKLAPFIIIILFFLLPITSNAQINEGVETVKNVKSLFPKKNKEIQKEESKQEDQEAKTEEANDKPQDKPAAKTTKQSFTSYSKYDFVPGEQVVFFEDFSQDAIGDFPVNWNTSGSGEVVTIESFEGRWLKWSAGVSYSPNLTTSFPDNFTLEFDILLQKQEDKEDPYFGLTFYSADKDILMEGDVGIGDAGMNLMAQSAWEVTNWTGSEVETVGSSSQVSNSNLYNYKTHVSIWGQKQRMRVYVNETKVLDLPKAFPQGAKLNRIRFSNNPGLNLSNDNAGPIYLANVRIAVGAPDMRSKLITEGKLVTRGILFDVNSDKIKGESYGTLKEISQVLKDNPTVRVKIVGHTDSDGNDAANLELSKRRGAAVKASLVKDFSIDASRMETDGKGKTEPVSPNTTPEGKANNRRVEFLKL